MPLLDQWHHGAGAYVEQVFDLNFQLKVLRCDCGGKLLRDPVEIFRPKLGALHLVIEQAVSQIFGHLFA